MTAFVAVLAVALLLNTAPVAAKQGAGKASEPNWAVHVEKPIFPSVLLSTAFLKMKNRHVLGDPHGVVLVGIEPGVAHAHVHVSVQVDGLSAASEYDGDLESATKKYVIAPTIRWNTDKLLSVHQPMPTTISVSVKENGKALGTKTKRVEVRAVNDVPFAVRESNGKTKDLSPLFAAFVNENSPVVDKILKKALYYRAVNSFAGYQQGEQNVEMQVFAIWNVLQREHVKYSSITRPSGASKRIYSQSVRFIGDSYRMKQANCVDGSVLFASVLYKIGLYPVLVVIPGHMFVGYYLDKKDYGHFQNMQFLETTLIGAGKQPSKYNWRFGHFLHTPRSTYSYRQFSQAVAYANKEYNKEALPGLRAGKPGYALIDIKAARDKGISPISE